MANKDTVILILSHVINKGVEDLFSDIDTSCSNTYDVIFLCDNTKGIFDRNRNDPKYYLFNLKSLECLQYPAKSFVAYGDEHRQENPHHKDFNFVPGSIDLPVIQFYRENPDYKHYWVVEYDVRYTGEWKAFFSFFENNESDLLGTSLVRYEDIPNWYHWPGLDILDLPIGKSDYLRGFFPVYRISNRAIAQLDRFYEMGVKGHFECVGPTLLRYAGLLVEDIGGEGELVRPENANRFYRNTPTRGTLSPGTFVFRPTMIRPGKAPGMLWHPVKYTPAWQIPFLELGDLFRRGVRRVIRRR